MLQYETHRSWREKNAAKAGNCCNAPWGLRRQHPRRRPHATAHCQRTGQRYDCFIYVHINIVVVGNAWCLHFVQSCSLYFFFFFFFFFSFFFLFPLSFFFYLAAVSEKGQLNSLALQFHSFFFFFFFFFFPWGKKKKKKKKTFSLSLSLSLLLWNMLQAKLFKCGRSMAHIFTKIRLQPNVRHVWSTRSLGQWTI